jgi:hypothetical protein
VRDRGNGGADLIGDPVAVRIAQCEDVIHRRTADEHRPVLERQQRARVFETARKDFDMKPVRHVDGEEEGHQNGQHRDGYLAQEVCRCGLSVVSCRLSAPFRLDITQRKCHSGETARTTDN